MTQDSQQYVLITTQPGADPSVNVYSSPDVDEDQLKQIGWLLTRGATPPMTYMVTELQPAKWDSI